VNPTYLWPGIVGGLIMGVGFIIGGFCPGTSLVSAATLKIDGIFFAVGGLFGIFLFGETVQYFEDFWNSSYYGRLTLMDWLNLPTGVVVLGVVLMALFMFWGGEQLERAFGGQEKPQRTWGRMAGVATLVAGALFVLVIGQPTTADKWARLAPEKEDGCWPTARCRFTRRIADQPGRQSTERGDARCARRGRLQPLPHSPCAPFAACRRSRRDP
jgi:hypothetical protein